MCVCVYNSITPSPHVRAMTESEVRRIDQPKTLTVSRTRSVRRLMQRGEKHCHPSVPSVSALCSHTLHERATACVRTATTLTRLSLSSLLLFTQSGSRRSNFSTTPRRQQQQQQQQAQNSANSMMQAQHGGHGQQDPLPSHCVSPMSQGGQGGSQSVPDPHQVGSRSHTEESLLSHCWLSECVC